VGNLFKKNKLIFLLTLLAFFYFTAFALEELPLKSIWPMRGGNEFHTGVSDYPGPKKSKIKWVFKTSAEITSSPVVNKERIFYRF